MIPASQHPIDWRQTDRQHDQYLGTRVSLDLAKPRLAVPLDQAPITGGKATATIAALEASKSATETASASAMSNSTWGLNSAGEDPTTSTNRQPISTIELIWIGGKGGFLHSGDSSCPLFDETKTAILSSTVHGVKRDQKTATAASISTSTALGAEQRGSDQQQQQQYQR
jgi:hypothetical protein